MGLLGSVILNHWTPMSTN